VNVNLTGTANALAAIMPAMIARRSGQIAIVSSVAGYRGLPRAIAYSATKAALIAMAESLKFDLDRVGVMVNVVNPGFVKTPLTDRNEFPMPFLMSVEAASERIVTGLARGRFEVCFPRRFAYMLKAMRMLPYALYFPLVGRSTGGR
jgi:short-subunit dehydrogenase